MPGYGKSSQKEWGDEIIKYLVGRQQLKMIYVLVDSVHGLKSSDQQLLSLLKQEHLAHQIVLTKVDRLLYTADKKRSFENLVLQLPLLDKFTADIKSSAGVIAPSEIVCCSSEVSVGGPDKLGLETLRWSILKATGLNSEKLPVAKNAWKPGDLYHDNPKCLE
ncbi:uncharacterized protein KY384_004372 [Bacidia gigantensis]|uniref:uncharacterized protein n=1 Tax=Bacidia gigantensis TaxID=2732470 RepID=UPI001D0448C7|nr:uncharacterized protein KY384_004372 [Bacidia gigantensis]KAG8531015.1 hypothetical protein KY384_004372 [Bacidia gigantensis]